MPTDNEIYISTLKKYGIKFQFEMLVEECAELIVAIHHLNRKRSDTLPVLEEIADVLLMIEQISLVLDTSMIDKIKKQKIHRLGERIGLIPIIYGD